MVGKVKINTDSVRQAKNTQVRRIPNRSRGRVRTIKLKGRTVIVEEKRLKANKSFGN